MPQLLFATALLAYAAYTDLRWHRIPNWAVGTAAALGVLLAIALRGGGGAVTALLGIAAGAVWWAAVAWAGLGAGDAKLAMALGAILGPGAAVAAPAAGFILCALALVPWILWRRARGHPWRHAELAMAPWIAAGLALTIAASRW